MRRNDTSPRALMEQAVDIMRKSIAEPRADGKASPKVGAYDDKWRDKHPFNPIGTVSRQLSCHFGGINILSELLERYLAKSPVPIAEIEWDEIGSLQNTDSLDGIHRGLKCLA